MRFVYLEVVVTRTAHGTFDVKLTPQTEDAVSPGIGRAAMEKRFDGDLVANSQGQMLSFLSGESGSAGYVAMELVIGSLYGRHGTFVLQHDGLMDRGAQQLSVVVVADSGTQELSGLKGHMDIEIDGGDHRYELTFTLGDEAG